METKILMDVNLIKSKEVVMNKKFGSSKLEGSFALRPVPYALCFRGLSSSITLCAVLFALCLVLPLSALGADKLIVKDAGGVNTKFVVQDTGYTGIGTATPSRILDVSGGVPIMQNSGTAGFDFRNTGATFGASVSVGTSGNPNLYANWSASANAADDVTKPSWGVRLNVTNDKIQILRAPAGGIFSDLIDIFSDGRVGLGTTAPTQKLDINSNGIRIEQSRTISPSSTACNQGEISWDASYVYVCVGTNQWKRAALSSY